MPRSYKTLEGVSGRFVKRGLYLYWKAHKKFFPAERLRGKFKAYDYKNVILPIMVIRHLECVLIKWREEKATEVKAKRLQLTEKELANLVKGLETSTAPFSNKTDWTLRQVYEEDQKLLEENFRAYINCFSKNVDDIIEYFNYRATIGLMVKNNRLAPIKSPTWRWATSRRNCYGGSRNKTARRPENTSPHMR